LISIKEESNFNYKPWFVLTFLLGVAEGLVGTFFPLVFLHFGGTNFELGLFVGIISLLGSFQIFWGKFIDRFEIPKRLSVSALAANCVVLTGMGLTSSANVFGISRSVNGLSNSAFANGDYFLRTAYFPVRDRGRTNNYFMAINLFGVAAAITFVGFIYDEYGFGYSNVVHFIAAGLFLLSFILYKTTVPEFNPKFVRDEQIIYTRVKERANLHYSFKEIYSIMKQSAGLNFYILGRLIFNFGVAFSGPFFIVVLNRGWGFNNSELALMLSFNAIIQVVAIVVLLPFIDFLDRKQLMTFGLILATIPAIAISLKPEWIEQYFGDKFIFWMGIFFISSIGWGIVNSTTLTLLVDYVHPKIRSTVIAGYGSVLALLSFFAAISGGILIDLFSPNNNYFFVISSAIRIFGVLIIIKTQSPPIPFADFYVQRQIFFTRFRTSFERVINWMPLSLRLKTRNKRVKK
jgi:MFS family permease